MMPQLILLEANANGKKFSRSMLLTRELDTFQALSDINRFLSGLQILKVIAFCLML